MSPPDGIPMVVVILFWVVFLLFGGVVHEFCHAYAAHRQGDPTPSHQGRVTLNPIPHLDPVWTFLMPVLLLIATGGQFAFGGARPVAMNPAHFRDPEKGFMWAAAVGPLSNFLLAGIALLTALLLLPADPVVEYALTVFYFVNVLLGVFNLIPIPPLDGSRILRYFLPARQKRMLDDLEQYGILIVFGAIAVFYVLELPVFYYLLRPFLSPAFAVGLF